MTEQEILRDFPTLRNDPDFCITSPEDKNYNCTAWALIYDDRWVQPPSSFMLDGVHFYWPEKLPTTFEINSYIELFKLKGYEICSSEAVENGYRKIALYKDNKNEFTHAARQKDDGSWTSKLGAQNDIKHSNPKMLESNGYGQVAVIMRKRIIEASLTTYDRSVGSTIKRKKKRKH